MLNIVVAISILLLYVAYIVASLFTIFLHAYASLLQFISSRACYYYCHGRGLVERALTHVVLKAVSGGFLAQDPANTKYIACIVDVSYEWSFLGGPRGRLGVSLDF